MIFDIYKLSFKSPLHLSKGKLNSYESSDVTLHSDTIKSALFVSMLQLYNVAEANNFMETVNVSSAFPFNELGCWLPKPLSFSFGALETSDNRKKLKQIKFFTSAQYTQVLNGETPILDKDFLQPKVWKSDITQRVKINYYKDSEPFYLEKLYPENENSGLYFIFLLNGFEAAKLNAAMNLLGDNGFGLQRTLGNGQFEPTKSNLEIELPENSTAWVSLSLYRPKNKEEIGNVLEKSSYQYIKRGGWISSPEHEEHLSIRKQAVMMFTEGSVFGFEERRNSILIKGMKENLRPLWNEEKLHNVYRDGNAIFLPILN